MLPMLLLRRIDAAEAIGEALERAQERIEPGAALRVEHLKQVQAERLGDEQKQAQIKRQLKPAECSYS